MGTRYYYAAYNNQPNKRIINMGAKRSAAMQRAMDLVSEGWTVPRAAREEGVTPAALYAAIKKLTGGSYPYRVGMVFRKICNRYGGDILVLTAAAIAKHPSLMTAYLCDLDLSDFPIPKKPRRWERTWQTPRQFWAGYHSLDDTPDK